MRVEFLDDVDFSASGSPIELVQSKHRIGDVADLQDSSAALWKSLRIWVARVEGGLDPEDVVLALVTTGRAPEASAAALLRPGDGRDPSAALERLLGVAARSTNQETTQARASLLNMDPSVRERLFRRIFVLDSAPRFPDLADRIEREVRRSCRPNQTELFREHLEGWWFGRCVESLSAEPSAGILYGEVEARIDLLRGQFRDDNLPVQEWDTAADALVDDFEGRLFLRQLQDIGILDSRTLLRAIRDYLRAFSHRSRWTRGGVLDPQELQAFDERLREEWEIHFSAMERELGSDATEERKQQLAQELFTWMETSADQSLRPRFQQRWATRGSYHGLADKPIIGWHVDFEETYGASSAAGEVAS